MAFQLATEIIQYVKTEDCHKLEYKKLGALLELVIHNKEVVDILKTIRISHYDNTNSNNNCFSTAYSYYITKNKQFILLQEIDSLALSWLHCLYH